MTRGDKTGRPGRRRRCADCGKQFGSTADHRWCVVCRYHHRCHCCGAFRPERIGQWCSECDEGLQPVFAARAALFGGRDLFCPPDLVERRIAVYSARATLKWPLFTWTCPEGPGTLPTPCRPFGEPVRVREDEVAS